MKVTRVDPTAAHELMSAGAMSVVESAMISINGIFLHLQYLQYCCSGEAHLLPLKLCASDPPLKLPHNSDLQVNEHTYTSTAMVYAAAQL